MERLFSLVGSAADPRLGGADSFCDRLNCTWSVYILVLFAIVVTTSQSVIGNPVACWCPSHFENSHVEFTNKVSKDVMFVSECCNLAFGAILQRRNITWSTLLKVFLFFFNQSIFAFLNLIYCTI